MEYQRRQFNFGSWMLNVESYIILCTQSGIIVEVDIFSFFHHITTSWNTKRGFSNLIKCSRIWKGKTGRREGFNEMRRKTHLKIAHLKVNSAPRAPFSFRNKNLKGWHFDEPRGFRITKCISLSNSWWKDFPDFPRVNLTSRGDEDLMKVRVVDGGIDEARRRRHPYYYLTWIGVNPHYTSPSLPHYDNMALLYVTYFALLTTMAGQSVQTPPPS